MPTGRHENLARKVIDLVGHSFGEGNLERNGIAHIAVEKFNFVLNAVQEAHGVGLAPHQAINFVLKIEQIFGKITAVLTGNSRD
jgi:hypothetical protein